MLAACNSMPSNSKTQPQDVTSAEKETAEMKIEASANATETVTEPEASGAKTTVKDYR